MQDYTKQALRTESPRAHDLQPWEQRLLHAAMGIQTELAELLDSKDEVNLVEESGDVLWYLGIGYDAINQSIEYALSQIGSTPLHRLNHGVQASGDLTDVLKRRIFYGSVIVSSKAAGALDGVLRSIVGILAMNGHTVEEVMAANIAKLRRRFPEKFTQQLAENRDLNTERDALEGIVK